MQKKTNEISRRQNEREKCIELSRWKSINDMIQIEKKKNWPKRKQLKQYRAHHGNFFVVILFVLFFFT